MKARSARFRIVAATIGIAVPLLAAFAAYRIRCGWRPNVWPETVVDPKLGAVFPPHAIVDWAGGASGWPEFHVVSTANSRGFLDAEHEFAKPAGTRRIVVLGDSFVEAAQVELEERYHRLLERGLTEAGVRTECIALAHSGYGTSQLLPYYTELGRKYAPELVVLVFVPNDFRNNCPELEGRWSLYDPTMPPWFTLDEDENGRVIEHPISTAHATRRDEARKRWRERTDQEATLFRFLWTPGKAAAVFGDPDVRGTEAWDLTHGDRYQWRGVRTDDVFLLPDDRLPEVAKKGVRLTRAALERLAREVRADGSKLAVVLSSNRQSLESGPVREVLGVSCDRDVLWKRVTAMCEALGVPVLDLEASFRRRPDGKDANFRKDGHWTPTGHVWAAEETAAWIRRAKLLE